MNEGPKPNPDLKGLDKLIGTWKQSGELDGETTFEWAEAASSSFSMLISFTVKIKSKAWKSSGMNLHLGLSPAKT